MREILFRGKEKNSGEWIYGDLRHISDGHGGGDVLADRRTRKGGEKTEICQSVYRKNTERGDTQLRGAKAAVQNGKVDI